MAFVTMRVWNGSDWDTISDTRAAGGVMVYMQDVDPAVSGKYVWLQTNVNPAGDFTLWFNDGV